MKERRSYNFRNWPSHSGNDKHTVVLLCPFHAQTFCNSRQEALEAIENMRVSAGLIEENEKSKGPNGLVILEAYYGAIENVVDPSCTIDDIVIVCYSPHMQAYGRVLDVKIPLLCLIDNSQISHRSGLISCM